MCPDSPELLRERASVYGILGHHNKALDDYNVRPGKPVYTSVWRDEGWPKLFFFFFNLRIFA